VEKRISGFWIMSLETSIFWVHWISFLKTWRKKYSIVVVFVAAASNLAKGEFFSP